MIVLPDSRPQDEFAAPTSRVSASVSASSKQDRIRRLIEDAGDLSDKEMRAWKERARLAVSAVYGDGSTQVNRFDDIRWSLSAWSDSTPSGAFTEAERRGLRRSIELLQAVLEDLEEQEKTPGLPGLDVADFHPWVAESAARLWQDGHRRQAVQAASAVVEKGLRAKTGVHQGSIASLAAAAFSPDKPKSGSPRLRFSGFDPVGSDGWNSAHEGAGAFGRGCFLRIRNLYTHHDGEAEQEDLEALAALSLLARWIEDAAVETADFLQTNRTLGQQLGQHAPQIPADLSRARSGGNRLKSRST